MGGNDARRVIAFAESAGYATVHVSAGYSNHRHPDEAFGNVDFMYVYGDTARQVFAGVIRRSVAGMNVAVARPEHLVAMKERDELRTDACADRRSRRCVSAHPSRY